MADERRTSIVACCILLAEGASGQSAAERRGNMVEPGDFKSSMLQFEKQHDLDALRRAYGG